MGACFETTGWKYKDQVYSHTDGDRTAFTLIPFVYTYADVSLKLLLKDLEYVWRWYPLGIQLGVPDAHLKMIESDFKRTEDMKLHSLSEWMKIDEQPSWSKVVRALVAINERHAARNITDKYGKFY